jgi:hypothetical protein
MSIGSVGIGKKPRFRRGIRSIVAFYNEHADQPIDDRKGYKMIARGTIPAGHDGTTLIAEEGAILAALLKIANAA